MPVNLWTKILNGLVAQTFIFTQKEWKHTTAHKLA